MAGFKGYRRSIVLDFNYDSVKNGVAGANKQMALLNSEFKKQMEQAKATGNSMDKLGLKQDALANKVKIQGDKVSTLRKQLEQLTTAENKNQKAITNKTIELNNAEAALTRMQSELKQVNKEVDEYSRNLDGARGRLNGFVESMEAGGQNLDELGGKFQKVGAALAAIGVAGAKFRGDFDQNMAMARTIMDETQVGFKEMGDSVIDLSDKMNIAAADVANGLYQTLSSNISTADSMKLLSSATLLAKTGFTDTGTAVDILTTMINSYGLEISSATKLVDQLVKTQEVGKITVGQFGESFGKVAGLAATVNFPLEQLQAAIATLTQSGVKASEAITGVRAVLAAVISPTQEAKEAAKELGINFSIGGLRAKGFSGFLEEVKQKTHGSEAQLSRLFGRVEGLNSMFILTGKGAENYAENVEKITNSAGTAEKALVKLETPSENFSNAVNRFKNSLMKVGEQLAPVVNLVALLIKGLSHIPAPLLVIVSIAGMLSFTLGSVLKVIKSASTAASTMNTVFGSTNFTMQKVALTIISVAAAIALVLALLNVLLGKGNQLESFFSSFNTKATQQVSQMQRQSSIAQGVSHNTGIQGSHATGLRRVPHDRYVAELHEGEAVIPKSQNPYINGNGGFGGGDTININVYADNLTDLNRLAKQAKEFKQTARAYGRG
ncbi:putative tail tapemeasure protein [uncultured Caudovirales phage]|uniref:Putative tail tapemeasure protein n=1 Tax=uncultured Caudovirales phage TaxID=2100421 RepID=A0A2H4JDX3_9CAUD|nr:putative tail tapemeasure protein [uncultured Caudovirales phage]